MNKTITIYELLGLIKDGKAPKRILFDETEYYLLPVGCYVRELNGITTTINSDYNILLCLNDEVEILEEDKPIIEKLDLFDDLQDILNSSDESIVLNAIHKCLTAEKYKLNEVIEFLNRKEDK